MRYSKWPCRSPSLSSRTSNSTAFSNLLLGDEFSAGKIKTPNERRIRTNNKCRIWLLIPSAGNKSPQRKRCKELSLTPKIVSSENFSQKLTFFAHGVPCFHCGVYSMGPPILNGLAGDQPSNLRSPTGLAALTAHSETVTDLMAEGHV